MLHIRQGIFIALIAIGVGRFAFSAGTGSNAPRTATHSPAGHSNTSHARQREHRERAWRDWYHRYHRIIRPGYIYPGGYPPGYTPNSTPTTGPSGGENNGVVGNAPNGNNGALFHNNAVDPPAAAGNTAASTRQQVDPDVLAAVARVKEACKARPDYQAAVADKKSAEDRLAALRPDGQEIAPAIAMPLANAALEASQRISAIELEETTKDAQKAGLPPQTQPGEAAAK